MWLRGGFRGWEWCWGGGEGRSRPCSVVLVVDARSAELVSVRVLQWGVFPLSLGFQEEGEGVATALCVSMRVLGRWSQDASPDVHAIGDGVVYT